uniref:EF-hand domain-containing protein n=1 Tax=Salix viminalis TaxID=40686 RepID=A0A6N2KAJ4_SALVM
MRKERRSRIGSYAISSSMSTRDHRQQPCITCTTFNILAPIYKRLNINNDQDQNSREKLVNMYEKRLGDAGYLNFKLARTNNRGDGLQNLQYVNLIRKLNADNALRYLLRRASLTEKDAFAFLKADSDSDWITYSGFCEALQQLNLTGHCNGLSDEETKDLWVQADIDGNGVLDYKEFQQRIWNPTWSEQKDDVIQDDSPKGREEQTIGFSVENAVLFPPEVEKGMWPENYSLSDHARLTVVFSPIRMPCSQLIS